MDEGSTRTRSLVELRAMIDALDRDLLQVLVKRMALVGEIAQYKREHAVPIRDLAREREILEDRCSRAVALGLPQGEIEALYRLVLWTSREQQAALRVEVPQDLEPRTVAVVGGKGEMGACLAHLFEDLGNTVLIADLDTELTPVEAATAADVVIISVPIDVTEQVIRDLGPHVRPEGLLMDVTSLKQGPVEAMLESTSASVLGTHPMFGPDVHSFQGQRIVLCRGRGDAWADWVTRMLQAHGVVITEATPEEHDRAMAMVQVLIHFQTEAFGLALSRMGVTLADTLRFTSPAYLLELYVAARHFAQSPALYGPIEMTNPLRAQATRVFTEAVSELSEIIVRQDQAGFDGVFDRVREFFGPFSDEALEQSSFLIDRLVERS